MSAEAFPQAQFVQLAQENWELFLSTLAPRGLPIDEYDVWISDTRASVMGNTNQGIADALVISPSTVAKHVSSILAKTGAANRAEAAAFAGRNGITRRLATTSAYNRRHERATCTLCADRRRV